MYSRERMAALKKPRLGALNPKPQGFRVLRLNTAAGEMRTVAGDGDAPVADLEGTWEDRDGLGFRA